jgi:hypothetical protein
MLKQNKGSILGFWCLLDDGLMIKMVQLFGAGQPVELSMQAGLAQDNQGLVIAQPSDSPDLGLSG